MAIEHTPEQGRVISAPRDKLAAKIIEKKIPLRKSPVETDTDWPAYTGPRVGWGHCAYASTARVGPIPVIPVATRVVGFGSSARPLCDRHAKAGAWRA